MWIYTIHLTLSAINMNIHEKLQKVQVELKVKKSKFNNFGKYNYRSAEDILEAIKPLSAKHGVVVTVTELYNDGILESVAKITDIKSGESTQSSAMVGVDLNQKGMNKPQQFGSASSYGKKYALGNLLLIDDTADPDATNKHGSNASAVDDLPF